MTSSDLEMQEAKLNEQAEVQPEIMTEPDIDTGLPNTSRQFPSSTVILVLSIVSLVASLILNLYVVATVIAIIALNKAKKYKAADAPVSKKATVGKVLAIIGLVIGILNIASAIFALLFIIISLTILFVFTLLPAL